MHKAKEGYPLMAIAGAGSENRTTYFFNTEDGIIVRSACFKGTLEEFREKAKEHTSKLAKMQYLAFADIVEKTWNN
jgi:hypothetical protein